MAGKGRAYGDVGGLEITDLTNHDDVGILAHDVAQAGGKGETDLRVHVNLVDALHLVLNWVFDRDDLTVGDVDPLQSAVKRGALAAASRAGDKKDAVRF